MEANKEIYSKIRKKISPLRLLAIVIVTVIIFSWLFSKISFLESIKIMIKSNPYFILLSLAILFLSVIFLILRWFIILRSLNPEVKFLDSLISMMSALSLNSILPSKLGDVFKVYYFKEQGISKMLGSIFTERVFDIISLVLLLFLGSVIIKKIIFMYISIIIIFLFILLVSAIYLLRKKIKESKRYNLIKNALYSINWVIQRPRKAFILLFLSIVVWFCSIVQIYFLFLAVSINVDFIYFSSAIIIAIFVSLIPITIAGMGTRESVIIYLFSSFATNETLLAAGLLFSFFRYWLWSFIGLPFLFYSINRRRPTSK